MKNKILSFVGSRLEGRKGNTQRTSNLSPTNHQRYHRTWGAIFTLVMLFTFAIGQTWGQSFTFENSNSTTSVTTNNITYTCNGSGTSTTRFGSSLKFMNLGSGKQMQFVSTTNNISRIEIKACANNSAAKKCMTIKTSADASSYSVPSTFTATLDGSSATNVEDMSLTGTGESDWQTLVINFNANATLPMAFQILRGSNNLSVYSVKVYTAPTALATSDVTSEGVTFTVTDGASTNNYDIYYSTSSTSVPNSETSASTTISSAKTKSITGLESGQTYYAWVRSTWSSGTIKGDWRPSTASVSFTTESGGEDTTAPTLSSSVPANNATDVAVSGNIVLTFDENIASVDASKFTLTGATKGTVTIDGTDAKKVNVGYTAENNASVTLAVAAEAVADAAGNKSAALSNISFTTVAGTSYPEGYIYITDVMATPETGASATASSMNGYNTNLNSNFDKGNFTGTKYAITSSSSGYYTLTFSPALDVSTYSNLKLDVWWGTNGTGSNSGIKVNVNGTEVYNAATSQSTRNKIQTGLDKAITATSISTIQLKGNNNSGTVFFRVGIKGESTPSCSAPTSLTNGETTSTSQAVTWTAGGTESAWEVLHQAKGATAPAANATPDATVTSASYTFTGLTPSTAYDWYVRAKCGDSDKSSWVKGTSFTTSSAPSANPVITGAVNEDGWGTVSDAITVTANSTIAISDNVLTCDEKTLTASAAEATAEYTYAFDSWSGVTNGQSVTANVTATANFTRTPVNYTLEWNSNGGSELSGTYTSGTVAYGAEITKPANPTRSGYTFVGWAESTTGDAVVVPATMPAANKAYYAKWDEITCPTEGTVYSLSGWKNVTNESSWSGKSEINVEIAGLTITGGKAYAVSITDKKTCGTNGSGDNKTYKLGYGDVALRLSLDCPLQEGDIITITSTASDENAYIFTKTNARTPNVESTATSGSTKTYTVVKDDVLDGEQEVYIWRKTNNTVYVKTLTITRPEKFDITYWKNDGTTTKTVVEGTVIAANSFSREGYRFIEWNTQADGEGDKVNVGAEVTADTEVFAIWAQEFGVSYANTGAASGAAPTNENKYLANETFKVAGVGSMVAAENYVFGGWNDGTAIYQEDDDYTVTGTVSFVPVWNLQYTVTYKANGGTGDDIIVDNPATIADCVFGTPENKLFDKWNVSSEGDEANYAVGADVSATLVLYAIWKDDECTTNRKSIFKAVMTGDATATVTGENGKEYAGEVLLNKLGGSNSNRNTDASIEGVGSGLTTYKMNGTGAYMYGTLKKGAFQEGDKIQFAVSSTPGTLAIYGAKSSDLSQRVHIADMPAPNAAKVFTYTLTAANAAALAGYDAIGIYRADGVTMNPFMYSLEITGCRDWTILYDVTFDLNDQSGTAPEAQSIEEGGLVTKPADPVVEGYFFRGWFTDEECTAGNEWNFTNDVVGDENLTLYAKWEADPCTDKKSIVRVVMTGANAASSAGYNNDEYAGEVVLSGVGGTPEAAEVDANHDGNENGYKLSGGGSCLFAQLKKGVFQEGDVVKVTITKINDNYKVNNVAQQILDIYYGSSASDAALLATISNVDAAGTYSYRLTATDVATIGDKKCIGIYRPNSGRTQNQYVYSVEVSGCREWTAYHTLTFAKADETVVAAPALAEGVYASTVAPKAPRVSSHHFLGWSTTKNDADAIVNLAEYTITEDKTLYAVYAENDCSGNGLMFSQVAKANTLSEDYSLSGTTEESIGEYATVTGGEVYLNNNSSNTRVKITKTTSAIQLTGGDEGYIHVLLDCPLKEKDTIKVDNTNKWVIAHNASKTDKVSLVSSVHFFIVPAEWEGKDEFYIWRDGSSCNISTIQVIRPVLYTVSFDMMEHGSAIAALTGVPENGKITAPTAPTADNYSFGGWYKEEACTNAWDFANDVVTANTTLYAKWLNLYTVSFDMMEHGSAIAVLMDVPENSKITAPNVPTDENYYFEGWYKENTLENEWNFASDVVTDNTILYAKWNDKSDATLKSLYYGDVEIALEAGVYTYDVNLSPVATTVPALAAVTTNPNATKQITNGTLDEEGHAQSTVVVTPEKAGAATQTYTVNFTKVHLYTELVDVTGYTEWNWTGAASGETKINDVENRGKILANYIIGDNFEKLEGQEDARAYRSSTYPAYQGTYLKLHTTVPGKLTMNVRTSSNTPKLRVNGVDIATLSSTVTPYNVVVPAGDVEITSSADEIRIYSMIFDPALDPEKAEESTLKGYERDVRPGYYGTICLPKAGVMTGATLYEIAYRDLNDPYKKIFFDEVLNGTMRAGVPYIFLPNEDVTRLGVYYTNTEVENEAKSANGLKGYYDLNNDDPQAAFEIVADQGNYIIKDNQYREVTVASAYIVQNRAYIKTAEINPTYVAPQPNRRRVAINGAPSVATDIDNIYGNDTKAQKVLINGQLFIIRGEKMYDAAGQLVK